MIRWDRILKGVFSVGLLLASAGYYVNNHFRLVASYAAAAAPAIAVQAPSDGVLSHSVRSFSVLPAKSTMASVKPSANNDPELRAATAELTTVRADVASLKHLLSLSDDMQSQTANRESALGARRNEQLQHLVEQADSDLAVKKAAADGADLAVQRSQELCTQGLTSKQECDAVHTKAEIAARELTAAQRQLEIARFLLASKRSGVDVGLSVGSEVTYARQQHDELKFRLAALRKELETEEAHAKALEVRISPPAVDVAVSARSRVWSVLRQSGTLVVKGEPLFELVDCDQLFIFATVSENRYDKLRIGTAAKVTIHGHTYPGKIVQLLGPYGTFSEDRSMRPQPPVIVNGVDANSAAVAIEVPELASVLGPSCEIGTRAEVEFVR